MRLKRKGETFICGMSDWKIVAHAKVRNGKAMRLFFGGLLCHGDDGRAVLGENPPPAIEPKNGG
jgi:hypothetical protein